MPNEPTFKRVKRLDSVPLEKVEYTPEGFLIDTPIVTSVGVFDYHNPDGSVRRELRLPEHVFNEESLATYEGKSVIITHEAGRVDKENVTEEIVGTILSPGYQDENDVRAKIIIHDIDAVKQSGMARFAISTEEGFIVARCIGGREPFASVQYRWENETAIYSRPRFFKEYKAAHRSAKQRRNSLSMRIFLESNS